MFEHPIIKEIRDIRHAIEAECDNDGDKYYEHILQLQQSYKDRLIRRQPKPRIETKEPDSAARSTVIILKHQLE